MHKMPQRRLTISLEDELEQAIEAAPELLGVPDSASASERLRAYARRGYLASLESRHDEQRLATYRDWAEAPEIGEAAAAFEAAAGSGVFGDD
ncbi:MAG TPA: hypothetical protein VFI37_09940 [Gaiellaceae bacterium]|jgi:hypothetical protein|nr:hypothetical protein [Gaiellaceae bacterium]